MSEIHIRLKPNATLHTIWCEWDIGQEGRIFTSVEAAKKDAKELWDIQFGDEPDMDFDECWEDLIGVEHQTLII